jgi:preprotein translocase subunit SecG
MISTEEEIAKIKRKSNEEYSKLAAENKLSIKYKSTVIVVATLIIVVIAFGYLSKTNKDNSEKIKANSKDRIELNIEKEINK